MPQPQALLPDGLQPTTTAGLGVFGPNKKTAFHRWVSLTEGFSAQLAAQALADVPPNAHIFDPFGGTGTTPLVAAQLGYRASWAEVNPYLRFAAETKIAAARASRARRRKVMLSLRSAAAHGPSTPKELDKPIVVADRQRDFFPGGAADRIVGWIARMDALDDELARSVGRLAIASCAIASSNMKRAVDLRRRTEGELKGGRPGVDDEVRSRIQTFVDDLDSARVAEGLAKFVSSDARSLPSDLEPIDLTVTSPPYLNGTNYVRNTKLELLITELVASEADLGPVRSRAVTAGINNVSKRIAEPERIAIVEPTAQALDAVAYDIRIPKMVRAYFADMNQVLAALARATRPGGSLILDIGDSRFAGVYVDTPGLLAQIAEGNGWHVAHTERLRDRTSKDGTPLCQKLLHFSNC